MTTFALLMSAALTLGLQAAPASDGAAAEAPTESFLKFETSKGDVIVMLDHVGAPITAANFLKYAEDGFYDGTIFHRVIKDFVIQGGGFDGDGNQKPTRDGIHNEWKNGLLNVRGSLSMARKGRQPNSGTSQFFVNVKDNAVLDQPRDGAGYAVFGSVVEGLDVVDEIRNVPTGTGTLNGGPRPDVPSEPVVVKKVTVVDAADLSEKAKEGAAAWTTRFAEQRQRYNDISKRHADMMKALEDATTTNSGLKYAVLEGAEGMKPTTANQVEVEYTGWFPEGGIFDSSKLSPTGPSISFGLGQVIRGWQEGVALMSPGASYVFSIPAGLAYGEQGRPGIPPNQTLIFEVKLIAIK